MFVGLVSVQSGVPQHSSLWSLLYIYIRVDMVLAYEQKLLYNYVQVVHQLI